jgi:hypothetical protein
MKLVASLPRLKFMEIGDYCKIADGAVLTLARCKSCKVLNHLSIGWRDGLIDVLCVAGRNLVSLDVWRLNADFDVIVEYCPNLQYFRVSFEDGMSALRVDG